jgi:hypothetical protein
MEDPMKRFALPLSILVVTLAACAGPAGPGAGPLPPEGAVTPQPLAYHAGNGVIQSVGPVPAPIAAVAGGSATTHRPEPAVSLDGKPMGPLNRVAVKMDESGDIMYVDTDAADLRPGMRVQLAADGKIRKL